MSFITGIVKILSEKLQHKKYSSYPLPRINENKEGSSWRSCCEESIKEELQNYFGRNFHLEELLKKWRKK
jgi:hypothetical protein